MKEAPVTTIPEQALAPESSVLDRYLHDIPAAGGLKYAPEENEAATPLQAFQEHVQDVRECGDALDFIPAYSQRHQVGIKTLWAPTTVAVATAETSGMLDAPSGSTGNLLGPIVIAGAGIAAGLITARTQYQRSVDYAHTQWNRTAQDRVREKYDLFRVQTGIDDKGEPTYEVHMRYYGPYDYRRHEDGTPETTAEYIHAMAALAESAGVDRVMLGSNMAKRVTGPGQTVPMKTILEHSKPLKLREDAFGEDVAIGTPKEWLEVQDRQRPGHNRDEVAGLIDVLKQVSYHHPLVKAYENHKDKPTLNAALQRAADTAIEREFSETGNGSKRGQVSDRGHEEHAQFSMRRPHHMSARFQGHGTAAAEQATGGTPSAQNRTYTIDWHHNGEVASRRPLDMVMGYQQVIQKHEDELLLRNPAIDPTRAKKLVVTLLKQRLDPQASEDQLRALPSVAQLAADETTPYDPMVDLDTPVLSQLLTNTKYGRNTPDIDGPAAPSNWRKIAVGGVALVAIGTGTFFGIRKAETDYQQQLDAAQAQVLAGYAAKYHLDPAQIDLDDPTTKQDIRDYAEAHTLTPVSKGWEWLRTRQQQFNELLDFDLSVRGGDGGEASGEPMPTASTSSPNTGVGDAPRNKPPQMEWALEPHDMAVDGYWAATTSNRLSVTPENGLMWINEGDVSAASASVAEELPTVFEGEQYIKVSRDLQVGDLPEELAGPGTGRQVRVPVLKGTRIAAAVLNGRPVTLVDMIDGTAALSPSNGVDNVGHLEYWLVPASDAGPEATASVTVGAKRYNYDLSTLPITWNDVIPGFFGKSPLEQRDLMEQYVKENFTYSFTPFSGQEPLFDSPEQYTEAVLELRRANCNVAATVLALGANAASAQAYPTYLNPAVGYLNDGDFELTDHEYHMWNVDTEGDIFDATPTKEEAKIPQIAPAEAPSDLPLKLAGLLLGATAAGFVARRPLRSAWRKVMARAASASADEVQALHNGLTADPETLHRALAIVEALRYDPQRDLARAARRPNTFATDSSMAAGMGKLLLMVHHDRLAADSPRRHFWQSKAGTAERQLKLSRSERRKLDAETAATIRAARHIMAAGRKLYDRTGLIAYTE